MGMSVRCRATGFGLSVALSLAGCEQAPAPPAKKEVPAKAAPEVPARAPEPRDPQLDLAFRAAFGQPPPAERESDRGWEVALLTYRPLRLVPLGDDRVALISTATTSDCHACSGAVAVHYLRRSGVGFALIDGWLETLRGNGWGRPPDLAMRADISDRPVIEARFAFGNQGFDCEWISLVELGPRRPVTLLDHAKLSYDNEGAGTEADGIVPETTSAVLIPGRLGRSFALRYSGTRAATVTYRRVDGTFRADRRAPIRSCE